MTDQSRIDFEAWAATKGMAMHLARAESGLYVSRVTQNYMDCWTASRVGQGALVEALTLQVKALQSDANSYQSGYDAGCAAAKAHADSWRAEAEALRKIISDSATACGAAVSVECSLEFMAMLPGEIGSVVGSLRKDAERYRWLMKTGLHTEIYAKSASIAPGRGPYICIDLPSCGAPNRLALGSGADGYIDAAMSKEAGQ